MASLNKQIIPTYEIWRVQDFHNKDDVIYEKNDSNIIL